MEVTIDRIIGTRTKAQLKLQIIPNPRAKSTHTPPVPPIPTVSSPTNQPRREMNTSRKRTRLKREYTRRHTRAPLSSYILPYAVLIQLRKVFGGFNSATDSDRLRPPEREILRARSPIGSLIRARRSENPGLSSESTPPWKTASTISDLTSLSILRESLFNSPSSRSWYCLREMQRPSPPGTIERNAAASFPIATRFDRGESFGDVGALLWNRMSPTLSTASTDMRRALVNAFPTPSTEPVSIAPTASMDPRLTRMRSFGGSMPTPVDASASAERRIPKVSMIVLRRGTLPTIGGAASPTPVRRWPSKDARKGTTPSSCGSTGRARCPVVFLTAKILSSFSPR
mmetsp:Transcript_2775/g.6188  ORF Transcript_2775/g.6188 Transcript_2775/m.6188 type:complete len:343 (+) Transcript_2775:265-1293(+)